MTYIGTRLRYLRKLDNITQQELATHIGISKSTISMYENGQREPDFETLEKIADFFNVPMNTFFPGDQNDIHLQVIKNIMPLPHNRAFPLVGSIPCGTPILADENITEYVQFPGDLNADFCLQCKGDSMINARIYDGDIVFIRKQALVENGEIAAVRIGDEATLKRVYYTPGSDRITLRPCNPLYPDMEYEGASLNEIEILGKAVSFLSNIR